jgi:hypothetical protein
MYVSSGVPLAGSPRSGSSAITSNDAITVRISFSSVL